MEFHGLPNRLDRVINLKHLQEDLFEYPMLPDGIEEEPTLVTGTCKDVKLLGCKELLDVCLEQSRLFSLSRVVNLEH